MTIKNILNHPSIKAIYGESMQLEGHNDILNFDIKEITNWDQIPMYKDQLLNVFQEDIKYRQGKKELAELQKKKEEKLAFENAIKSAIRFHVGQQLPTFKNQGIGNDVGDLVTNKMWEKHSEKFTIQDGALVYDEQREQHQEHANELDRLLASASVLRFGQDKPTLKDEILKELSRFQFMTQMQ